MGKDEIKKELSLINRVTLLDNPILRHYIKKHRLNETDSMVLGILLELTNQGKVQIRTHYNVIAQYADLPPMDVYHSINSLHRYRIIEYKPSGNFVHISFGEIDDNIEEIALAFINARKIKLLESDVEYMKKMKYVPSADLFDLITPIIGKIITKKIAETLRSLVNYINDRLESTMSMRMWKYRFIALRTRLPLAEIILRESLACVVDEILIIEKKSSLLIAQASRFEEHEADRDLVVAMLSAITDFIRTSFNRNNTDLNEISFGDSRILVFESTYFYAAFVVHGSPAIGFLGNVDSLMHEIHIKYRNPLKNFKGAMTGFSGMEEMLHEFINSSNAVEYPGGPGRKSFTKLKVATGIISIAILIWLVFFIIGEIKDYRLEKKINAEIDKTLPPFSHDLELDVNRDTLVIKGVIGSPQTGTEIEKIVKEFPEIKFISNRTVSADFKTVDRFKHILEGFEKKFSDLQLLFVRQELEKIVIQFPTGITSIGSNQVLQSRKIYEILRDYPDIHVDIIAFNDPVGGYNVNKKLAEERMAAIKNFLITLGMDSGRIHITEFNPDVISADPRFAQYIDRRGIMLFARLNR
jgi:hypothetical protein